MPVVDGAAEPDDERAVYLMTRDNMLEGDSGASGVARRIGRDSKPPAPLRIQVPAHVGSNFEGLVVRVADGEASGGAGHLWKLVRTFDDPATWTDPGVRHLAANGPAGEEYRTRRCPTSGSSTTSTPTRSRRGTGGTTGRPPTSSPTWRHDSSRNARPACPNETTRGRTSRDTRQEDR